MPTIAPLRKALIPAAGLGTRMLPAAKAVPKELLPILDRPTIQYVVEEARRRGVERCAAGDIPAEACAVPAFSSQR